MTLQKKACYTCFFLILNLLLLEAGLRCILVFTQNASFFRPSRIFLTVYPELGKAENFNTGSLNILVLGGSVLNPETSFVQPLLEKKLRAYGLSNFRICNVSQDGHTTRDSLLKYRALAKQKFDIVVVYHAINDVVANNCPPELFQSDYSHYSRHEVRNTAARHLPFIDVSVIPYSLEYAYRLVRQRIFISQYIPLDDFMHQDNWLKYGGDIKTAGPFRDNLNDIIGIATDNHTTAVLMTFANYMPADYSYYAFKAALLDYSYNELSCNTEVWGKAENVVKGIHTHNTVIRSIVKNNRGIEFIDMENILPKTGRNFVDICHFSEKGADIYASALASRVMDIARKRVSGLRGTE
jgi:hypothetical protein